MFKITKFKICVIGMAVGIGLELSSVYGPYMQMVYWNWIVN
jgi:hypothetical protein